MGKGRPCPRGATSCAKCGGSHGAREDLCAAKRSARQLARGSKSPPPPRRERKAPESETTAAQVETAEAEVRVDPAPAPEEMEE